MSPDDLKTWAQDRKLSPEGMAQYVGVPVNTWRNWTTNPGKAGHRKPPAVALRLFEVLRTIEVMAPTISDAMLPRKD